MIDSNIRTHGAAGRQRVLPRRRWKEAGFAAPFPDKDLSSLARWHSGAGLTGPANAGIRGVGLQAASSGSDWRTGSGAGGTAAGDRSSTGET